eukprot:COSAG01_NODE_31_length_35900_cov_44.332169_15_plen_180_part_00
MIPTWLGARRDTYLGPLASPLQPYSRPPAYSYELVAVARNCVSGQLAVPVRCVSQRAGPTYTGNAGSIDVPYPYVAQRPWRGRLRRGRRAVYTAVRGTVRGTQSALKLNFACSPKHPKFGCCARLRQPARFYAARSEIFPNSDRGPTGLGTVRRPSPPPLQNGAQDRRSEERHRLHDGE